MHPLVVYFADELKDFDAELIMAWAILRYGVHGLRVADIAAYFVLHATDRAVVDLNIHDVRDRGDVEKRLLKRMGTAKVKGNRLFGQVKGGIGDSVWACGTLHREIPCVTASTSSGSRAKAGGAAGCSSSSGVSAGATTASAAVTGGGGDGVNGGGELSAGTGSGGASAAATASGGGGGGSAGTGAATTGAGKRGGARSATRRGRKGGAGKTDRRGGGSRAADRDGDDSPGPASGASGAVTPVCNEGAGGRAPRASADDDAASSTGVKGGCGGIGGGGTGSGGSGSGGGNSGSRRSSGVGGGLLPRDLLVDKVVDAGGGGGGATEMPEDPAYVADRLAVAERIMRGAGCPLEYVVSMVFLSCGDVPAPSKLGEMRPLFELDQLHGDVADAMLVIRNSGSGSTYGTKRMSFDLLEKLSSRSTHVRQALRSRKDIFEVVQGNARSGDCTWQLCKGFINTLNDIAFTP